MEVSFMDEATPSEESTGERGKKERIKLRRTEWRNGRDEWRRGESGRRKTKKYVYLRRRKGRKCGHGEAGKTNGDEKKCEMMVMPREGKTALQCHV